MNSEPHSFSPSPAPATIEVVDSAITSRRSVRAFLPDPIPRHTIEGILRVASRAPSGTNIQPWNVHVVVGGALDRLTEAIVAAYENPEERERHQEEYPYYPQRWVDPYLARRRKVGWDLYGLLGIDRDDDAKKQEQQGRNLQFFDAPVGMVFSIDRNLSQGSWLDYGMFLQNVMIAARARGLDTCPQASFNPFHRLIRAQLGISEDYTVVCAMALGKADPNRIENSLVTEREPVENFVHFVES